MKICPVCQKTEGNDKSKGEVKFCSGHLKCNSCQYKASEAMSPRSLRNRREKLAKEKKFSPAQLVMMPNQRIR